MAIHVSTGNDRDHMVSKIKDPSTISSTETKKIGNPEKENIDINDHPPSPPSPPNSLTNMEETYTSLIQQYLSLLCFENASFLAERMTAECPSKHSYYLLATCYYRMGQVKRAYSVLMEQDANLYVEKDGLNEVERGSGIAARYLLAKCCIDLGFLEEAEDCLLPGVRERAGPLGWGNSKKKQGDDDTQDNFTQWILSKVSLF